MSLNKPYFYFSDCGLKIFLNIYILDFFNFFYLEKLHHRYLYVFINICWFYINFVGKLNFYSFQLKNIIYFFPLLLKVFHTTCLFQPPPMSKIIFLIILSVLISIA